VKTLLLGRDRETGKPVEIPVDAFRTHVHLPGATGKGKSTAILSLIQQLLLDWREPACHVLVDFLGGLAQDLLMWMASPYCTQQARDRLVLLRPSDHRITMTLNPLLYDDEEQGYFKVNRAAELVLRAWTAQSLAEQPRLARWLFNAFWACARLGLTVADTEHLLIPGSPFHGPLLSALPERLRYEWHEVLNARGGEATRILDSTRNRMKPFHESGILRRMFGSVENRLDALRFMREGKILILDLSPGGRLSGPEANAIAGLVVNEFLAAARSLPREIRYPTYLWLDEFQRLVSPDLEYAIPEMRQLGIRLILAHQSFSQLKTPEADLTSLIWQPQTRLAFGEAGEDADILAAEFASLTFEPKWIKEELYSLRQLQTGHEKVQLSSWARGLTESSQWQKTYGDARTETESEVRRDHGLPTRTTGTSGTRNSGGGDGGGTAHSQTESTHEQLIATLETIRELSNRTFYSFEEQRELWAKRVRHLRTGQCVTRVVNDEAVRLVQVDQPKRGYLAYDSALLRRRFPRAIEAYEKLLDVNSSRDWFASPQAIDRETDERLRRVLAAPVVIPAEPDAHAAPASAPSPFED
jgi:TraM recognition site of TraD and TraG